MAAKRAFNGTYKDEYLNRVAFPMGGIGAGMVCLEGTGALSHVSIRNQPKVFEEPVMFSTLCVLGKTNAARVLEGPVPMWKAFGTPGSGNGNGGKHHGLPRFSRAVFQARFPFATIRLEDDDLPVRVELTGWSPFVPGDADSSSLPVAGLEYRIINTGKKPVRAVYAFHSANFLWVQGGKASVRTTPGGFILDETGPADKPHQRAALAALVTDPEAKVNCRWFRGGWFDSLTMAWNSIKEGRLIEAPPVTEGDPSPGGTLAVPVNLKPGQEKTIRLLLAWYSPDSDIRVGKELEQAASCGSGSCSCSSTAAAPTADKVPAPAPAKHQPWYAGRFADIDALAAFWRESYDGLRERSARFRDCFYDTTLPPEVVEAVAANMTILKSPTVLRQTDGRLWAWEGCCDENGCCHGSCTHVWNYAQAMPHLFPNLERTLRETEFFVSQNEKGHQNFRASLPIRTPDHDFHAAADGQLGGIMKVYREWRISGDNEWLRRLWPQVRQSLQYCIDKWDPDRKGCVAEPHHNTYDIEFWGPDGMCNSFYLGALVAAVKMADALGEEAPLFKDLAKKCRTFMEKRLFGGEYFIQKIEWKNLRAADPTSISGMVGHYSPEARALLEKEGPKYQYGKGCLSDGVLGAWLAEVSGVGTILDARKIESHLRAVYRYNFRQDLFRHPNPQRPSFALGHEAGLLLCSWPKGGALALPFVYSDEVWTGIEYHVAAHLMLMGCVKEGLEIVRGVRSRYDGRVRNPFNEYECGHWYARAMSSYALLQGMTGVRYDAVEKVLYIAPRIKGGFRAFLSTATGFGTVGVKVGQPFIEIADGKIEVREIRYTRFGAKVK